MLRVDELIIKEEDDFVAINKPSGLLTIPDREGKEVSLKELLIEKYGSIFTVHRLDRETSGLVIFARNDVSHKYLSQQFENRETQKIYNGLVLGAPYQGEGTINEPIAEHPTRRGMMTVFRKGKESITNYTLVENFSLFSWMEFQILTGRTHQIRVHMKYLGNPIACDDLYGDGKPVYISQIKHNYKLSKQEDEERPILNRLALHASQLTFKDQKNQVQEIEAPLPKDLKATLNQLRKARR